MVPVDLGKHLRGGGFPGGAPSGLKLGLAILLGVAAIAAALLAWAVASARFGVGPRMEPVAYVLLAMAAAVLLVNFLVTLVHNEVLAGLYLLLCWALTLSGAFLVFRYLG